MSWEDASPQYRYETLWIGFSIGGIFHVLIRYKYTFQQCRSSSAFLSFRTNANPVQHANFASEGKLVGRSIFT